MPPKPLKLSKTNTPNSDHDDDSENTGDDDAELTSVKKITTTTTKTVKTKTSTFVNKPFKRPTLKTTNQKTNSATSASSGDGSGGACSVSSVVGNVAAGGSTSGRVKSVKPKVQYEQSQILAPSDATLDDSFTFDSPLKKVSRKISKDDEDESTSGEANEKKRKLENIPKTESSSTPSKKLKESLGKVSDEKKPFSHKEIKPKSSSKKFIIGVTGGDFSQKTEVVNIIEKLEKVTDCECVEIGGSNFESFTHLVCLDPNPKKTIKLIYSIALNVPIIKSSWLYESEKANYFVKESDFYFSQYIRSRGTEGILKGKRCYILRGEVTFPSPEICERFIELSGGVCVEDINRANIIISTTGSKDFDNIIPRHTSSMPLHPVVTVRWLVDCVDKQQYQDPNEYKDDYYYSEACISRERILAEKLAPPHIGCLRLLTDITCSAKMIPLYAAKKSIVLGRATSDVDYTVDTENSKKNPVISRMHAKIVQFQQESNSQNSDTILKWKLIDSSANGTFVNCVKVKEAVLSNGDLVCFGHSKAGIKVGEQVPFVNTKCKYVFETEDIVSSEEVEKEKERLRKENELMRLEINGLRDYKIKSSMVNHQKEKEIMRLQELLSKNQRKETVEFPLGHKLFVLDTNVLVEKISILQNLLKATNTTCLIPYTVMVELDKLKTRTGSTVAIKAREAIRFLEECFENKSSANLIGQMPTQTLKGMEDGGVFISSADDHIINCCLYFKDHVLKRKEKNHELVLLTFDKNMRVKAGLLKIISPSILPFN